MIRRVLREYIRRWGYDVAPYPLYDYLSDHKIDCILDIGANVGQFSMEARRLGFSEVIYSFEPHFASFESLLKNSRRDPQWHCFNFGFGDSEREATLNVAEYSGFNSIFHPVEINTVKPTGFAFSKKEQIKLSCLDIFWSERGLESKSVYLKIDTQGYDLLVLKGARECLKFFNAVQVELSLTPLYKGQPSFDELVRYLRDNGFHIFGVWPGYRNPVGHRLYEIDAIFTRMNFN